MTKQAHTARKKSASFKNIIAIVIIILLVSGGVALAYVSKSDPTTKEKYFTAEKDSIDLYKNTFNKRYQTELDWMDYVETNPSETAYNFSLKYDGILLDEDLGMGISATDIIDNSRLTLTTQKDVKAKELATNLELDLSGIKIDDIDFYLTDEAIMLGLPFLDDVLKYSFQDLEELLHEEDPGIESGTVTVKEFFDILFNSNAGLLTEKDKAHFKKEYLDSIFDSISEDDFTTSEDTIDVNGQSVTTEKMDLVLEEDKVKDILITLLDKLESEEKIREVLEHQLATITLTDEDWANFYDELEDGITEAKEGVKALHIPDGLSSTIWIDDGQIVQRDFDFTIGPNANDLVTLSIYGEQLFEKEEQTFDYTFAVEDGFVDYALSLSGDLLWDGEQIDDTVKLEADDFSITYTTEETVDKKDREFNREFSVTDGFNETYGLLWEGHAAYEKDQMSSEHTFSIDDPYDTESVALQVGIDSKRIKAVDLPSDNIKDLGEMSETELMNYFEHDVSEQFELWLMKLVGFPGGF